MVVSLGIIIFLSTCIMKLGNECADKKTGQHKVGNT